MKDFLNRSRKALADAFRDLRRELREIKKLKRERKTRKKKVGGD